MSKRLVSFSTISFFLFIFKVHAAPLSIHCPIGCPESPKENDLVFYHIFALSSNPITKFSDWVAYEVNPSNFGESPGRKWKSDPLIHPENTLEPNDYSKANKLLKVDRGHLAPLASFAGSQYWYETNYLSNITPQRSSLNQKVWKDLEARVRDEATFNSPIWVITGTIYDNGTSVLPSSDESHVIPSAYYKIAYKVVGGYSAFLFPQTASDKSYCSFKSSLSAIQKYLPYKLPNPLLSKQDNLISCSE